MPHSEFFQLFACRCLSVSFSTHTCTRTHSGQPKVGSFFEVEVDRRKVPPSRLSSSSSPCVFSPAIGRRGSTQCGLFWKSRNERRVPPGDFIFSGSRWKERRWVIPNPCGLKGGLNHTIQFRGDRGFQINPWSKISSAPFLWFSRVYFGLSLSSPSLPPRPRRCGFRGEGGRRRFEGSCQILVRPSSPRPSLSQPSHCRP